MRNSQKNRAFTIVELLVVIGIIAVLMAMLMPVLKKAREQAQGVRCRSNLKQIAIELLIYSNDNNGWMFPVGPWKDDPSIPGGGEFESLGDNKPPRLRWPVIVFENMPLPEPAPTTAAGLAAEDPRLFNPPVMLCPTDLDPPTGHSYVVNKHLMRSPQLLIKYSTSLPGLKDKTQLVLMGEKVTREKDYYLESLVFDATGAVNSEFSRVVDLYRHGLTLGSNYLFMDMHVAASAPKEAIYAMDPWDPVVR